MEHVVGISWPRSGHHLLVRLLHLYFGERFNYCDPYAQNPDCCNTLPCLKPKTVHFTKSHDFQNDVPQVEGVKYLVQYRPFSSSVVSNFELYVRQGNEDSAASFKYFASKEFSRYCQFLKKWVHSDFASQQLVLNYDKLVAEPKQALATIVHYFSPEQPLDLARIDTAITQVDGETVKRAQVTRLKNSGVHTPRGVQEFRYYDPELFRLLENLRLTRKTVNTTFQNLLGRDASSDNMLNLQCLESTEKLETTIRASEEYARKQRN